MGSTNTVIKMTNRWTPSIRKSRCPSMQLSSFGGWPLGPVPCRTMLQLIRRCDGQCCSNCAESFRKQQDRYIATKPSLVCPYPSREDYNMFSTPHNGLQSFPTALVIFHCHRRYTFNQPEITSAQVHHIHSVISIRLLNCTARKGLELLCHEPYPAAYTSATHSAVCYALVSSLCYLRSFDTIYWITDDCREGYVPC